MKDTARISASKRASRDKYKSYKRSGKISKGKGFNRTK